MPEPTIAVAEPSPAAEVSQVEKEFSAWQKTIRPPETQPKPQEPAPADAPKVETAEEKSETAPEPAAGLEQKEKRPGQKLSAEERISQLVARNKEHEDRYAKLEKELRELREAQTKPAASSPAKAEPEPELKRPNWATWQGTVEEFDAAMEKYEAQKETRLRDTLKREIQEQHAQEELNRKTSEMLKEARTKYADFNEVTKPVHEAFDKAMREQKLHPAVIARMGKSKYAADIFYNLGKDPAVFERFLASATSDPFDALDRIRDVERLMEDEADKASEPKETPAPKAEKEEKPSAPPETKASKPPAEVGGRSVAPADAADAATKRRDFREFDREMTRRYVEKRK